MVISNEVVVPAVVKTTIVLETDEEREDFERAIQKDTDSMCVHQVWEFLRNYRSPPQPPV